MNPKPIIYVSHITNLSDARYCAGMGADMLGFVVDPDSPDYVSPAQYQALVGWVSGPLRVAEIISPSKVSLPDVINHYAPDLLHVALSSLNQLPDQDLPLVLELPFTDMPHANAIDPARFKIEYLLITNLTLTSKHITFLSAPPVLVAIENPIASIADLLQKIHARGIALHGSRELTTGLKDYDHLSGILEELND